MKTIFEHTQTNVLVIPQALFAMRDVKVIKQQGNSAIFYKDLDQDLVDVEFYTNTPCFIYIDSGREVITNSENEVVTLKAGSAVFLPQGLNLHSDFVKETDALKAYLVFFDDDVVTDYLAKAKSSTKSSDSTPNLCLLEGQEEFSHFFDSIKVDIKDPAFINLKLQELLYLIAWKDNQGVLYSLLSDRKRVPTKRNLARLLEKPDVLQLSVGDLAHLSGRSLSSFNRDFKALYQLSPKKWLQEKRLTFARQLLEEQDVTVTDVALKVGYENVSNFIKVFKERYGLTPKQIKQSI